MTHTIKITDDKTLQAKSLLAFLKSLSETKDYSFLQIEQGNEELPSNELVKELDFRFEHFVKHGHTYKDWEDIKTKYIGK